MFSVFELSPPHFLVPFELATLDARGECAFRHMASSLAEMQKSISILSLPLQISPLPHSLISSFHRLKYKSFSLFNSVGN